LACIDRWPAWQTDRWRGSDILRQLPATSCAGIRTSCALCWCRPWRRRGARRAPAAGRRPPWNYAGACLPRAVTETRHVTTTTRLTSGRRRRRRRPTTGWAARPSDDRCTRRRVRRPVHIRARSFVHTQKQTDSIGLHDFDLLRIRCTTCTMFYNKYTRNRKPTESPQQKSTTSCRTNSKSHNKLHNLLYNKSGP